MQAGRPAPRRLASKCGRLRPKQFFRPAYCSRLTCRFYFFSRTDDERAPKSGDYAHHAIVRIVITISIVVVRVGVLRHAPTSLAQNPAAYTARIINKSIRGHVIESLCVTRFLSGWLSSAPHHPTQTAPTQLSLIQTNAR